MSSRAANNGANARVRIRAFPTNMDESYVNQIWDLLKRAIQEIQNKNNSGLSFEELYRNAYTMVLHKHGERLYNGLKEVIISHLDKVREKIVVSITNGSFLETLKEAWSDHTVAMVMIRDILMYMDRIYVQQNSSVALPERNFATEQYWDLFLRQTSLKLIEMDRQKNEINWMGIKSTCRMLVELGIESRSVYEEEFEKPLLKETADFYRGVCSEWLQNEEIDACYYLNQVETCMHDEVNRSRRYLDAETEAKILRVMDDVMVAEHMNTIVYMKNGGVKFMLVHKKIEDLTRTYRIFKRINVMDPVNSGSKVLLKAISEYLCEHGNNIVTDEELNKNPVNYVNELLSLKDYFSSLLSTAFSDERDYKNKFQHDFETFINSNTKSPEFVALYMDDMLKNGMKSVSDTEMDKTLDDIMILFRYLQEKDVFERYFKQQLAKRLLLDKSCSDDSEKALIGKLKTECGCQFTQKLESMFRDKELWNNLASGFRDYREEHAGQAARNRNAHPIEISVRVLTAGVWPTQQCSPVTLDPDCAAAYDLYAQYYMSKHNGRKLTLNTMLGTADVRATFYPTAVASASADENAASSSSRPARKVEHKILQVSTHQMIILLYFNYNQRYTYQQLLDDSKISEKDLKRNLQSLAMGKSSQRILCRKGKVGKDIEPSDEFSVNDAFTSKLTRVKVQTVSGKSETEPEIKETRGKVEEDRKLEVEAAIVRIMKARKRLDHNNLITEVTQQLRHRFLPDPKVIKKRIETLIEREYLARDDTNIRAYSYIA
ncbi:unnamed protein product [Caenorhabditis auriculariae]|uniref:Cullin family profile domain-containing protein n=1 Tax=Caenorhabditis auriculariae TaxID=2777116 RepID=A0A8S1H4B6_9PELO|nr:unnamed protein product [Caenorhabditis auriculariae]